MKFQTKEKVYLLVIVLLIALSAQFYFSFRYQPAHLIEVYYNQDHQLNLEVINQIREADKFVYFAVYTFTRADIRDALLAAKYRGLEVVGLTDRNQYNQLEQQRELIEALLKAEIPVYQQDHSAIMHLKVLVTDKAYVSGSFNWTSAATNLNDEVLEVGHYEPLRKEYENILKEMFAKYKSGQ